MLPRTATFFNDLKKNCASLFHKHSVWDHNILLEHKIFCKIHFVFQQRSALFCQTYYKRVIPFFLLRCTTAHSLGTVIVDVLFIGWT
jgi:hypothetical protein